MQLQEESFRNERLDAPYQGVSRAYITTDPPSIPYAQCGCKHSNAISGGGGVTKFEVVTDNYDTPVIEYPPYQEEYPSARQCPHQGRYPHSGTKVFVNSSDNYCGGRVSSASSRVTNYPQTQQMNYGGQNKIRLNAPQMGHGGLSGFNAGYVDSSARQASNVIRF